MAPQKLVGSVRSHELPSRWKGRGRRECGWNRASPLFGFMSSRQKRSELPLHDVCSEVRYSHATATKAHLRNGYHRNRFALNSRFAKSSPSPTLPPAKSHTRRHEVECRHGARQPLHVLSIFRGAFQRGAVSPRHAVGICRMLRCRTSPSLPS
jgi:hypothetical protein